MFTSLQKFIVESGQLQNLFKWLIGYYLYYKKCKVIAKEILDNHYDRLIVSDEDFASIAVAKEMGRRCVLITDIIETHFTSGLVSIIEKKMNKSMHKIMQACDCIIIPEVGDDKDNICHVGPIVRQASADRNTLRKQFGFEKNTILVSGGGTDAGKYLIQKAISVHRVLQNTLDSETYNRAWSFTRIA